MHTLARTFALATLLGLLAPSLAAAQATLDVPPLPPDLTPGETVLVTYETDRGGPMIRRQRVTLRGEFLMFSGPHLVVRHGRTAVAVDRRSIRSVQRQVGIKPASAPAMVLGSAAGFAAGFVIGAIAHSDGGPGGTSSSTNSGLAAGVLIGAPAGAFIAWLASRARPIYEEVGIAALDPVITMGTSGRVRVSMSVATR